jgi:hypothetical protein
VGLRGRPRRRHLDQPARQPRPAPPGPDAPGSELLRSRSARISASLAIGGPTTCSAAGRPPAARGGWSSRLLQGVLLELLADPATAGDLAGAAPRSRGARLTSRSALHAPAVGTTGQDGINSVGRGGPTSRLRPTASPPAASAWPSARPSCPAPRAPHPHHLRPPPGRGQSLARPRGRGRRAADPAHPRLVRRSGRTYLGCIRMAPSSRMTSPFR